MKVLGINISHHASIAEVVDGKVVSFYEEERFNRVKNFLPEHTDTDYRFLSIHARIDLSTVDRIVVASYDSRSPYIEGKSRDELIIELLEKQLKRKVEFYYQHHLYHALCGFYFSKFPEALCFVSDGGGASHVHPDYPFFQEVESAWMVDDKKMTPVFRHVSNARFLRPLKDKKINGYIQKTLGEERILISSKQSPGFKFATLAEELKIFARGKLGGFDAGKMMGLAAYGSLDGYSAEDLCAKVQVDTEKDTVERLQELVTTHNTKNIVLSGGYALNCVNNYKYTEAFPELNFFADPCAHDGGTAIGAALWGWRDYAN